jgi:hypothetical protein
MTAHPLVGYALAALLLGGCFRGPPSHELRVSEGTLRAFNRGEFGGHIEWCRSEWVCWTIPPPPSLRDTGTLWDLVRARELDDWPHTENAVALVPHANDEVVVLGGLSHMGLSDGWVAWIRGAPPRWQRKYQVLRGEPYKWCRDGKDLVVGTVASLTEADLVRVSPGGAIEARPVTGTEHPPRNADEGLAMGRAIAEALGAMDADFTDCRTAWTAR